MDSQELQKCAAIAIRQLQAEKEELEDKLYRQVEAEKLAFLLLKQGTIAVEELESKINEFSGKTPNDLEIIKQASEMTKIATSLTSFRLSESNARGHEVGATERFNAFLLDDTNY